MQRASRASRDTQSTLLYSTLLYFTLLRSTVLYSTVLYSTPLYSTLLNSTQLHSTLLPRLPGLRLDRPNPNSDPNPNSNPNPSPKPNPNTNPNPNLITAGAAGGAACATQARRAARTQECSTKLCRDPDMCPATEPPPRAAEIGRYWPKLPAQLEA